MLICDRDRWLTYGNRGYLGYAPCEHAATYRYRYDVYSGVECRGICCARHAKEIENTRRNTKLEKL